MHNQLVLRVRFQVDFILYPQATVFSQNIEDTFELQNRFSKRDEPDTDNVR